MSNFGQGSVSSDNDMPPSLYSKGKNRMLEPDDWKNIQDQKEKKKIQNRVAQRTYRHRIKKRLEHFEAMLSADDNRSSASVPNRLGYPLHSDSISAVTSESHEPSSGDSRLTTSRAEYVPTSSASDSRLLQDFLSLLDSKNEFSSVSESLQGKGGARDGGEQDSLLPNADDVVMQHNEGFPCFPSGSDAALKLAMQEGIEHWENDAIFSNEGPTPLCPDPSAMQSVASSEYTTLVETPDFNHALAQPTAPSSSISSLDDRMKSVIDNMTLLGFENVDSLAKSYYNHVFDDASSSIANEQRISRNRRLPTVFAEIFSAASLWSEWERRGFFEEVLRMNEALLISEASSSQDNIEKVLRPIIKSFIEDDTPDRIDVKSINRLLQDKLPNFWALMIALAQNSGFQQNSPASVTVAVVVLLRFTGKFPKQQLLSLVGACL